MRARGWLAAVVAVAACGGGGDDPLVDAPVIPEPCSNMPGTRFLDGLAVSIGGGDGPFPGEVCIQDHPELPCATPTVDGRFLMCVPTGAYLLQLVEAGYDTVTYPQGDGEPLALYQTFDEAFSGPNIWTPAGATKYPPTDKGFAFVGGTRDLGAGNFGSLAGAEMALSPTPALPAVYGGTNGLPDTALTTTSTAGFAQFADLDPGMYDVTITGATTCALRTGTGFESPVAGAAVRMPVFAGQTTFVHLLCTP
jgi:hypothetical protein